MSSSISTREVVVDAGPVIALARLDLLAIPGSIFGKVLVTEVVMEGCLANPEHPEHHAIRLALENGRFERIDWLKSPQPSMWNLDPGEASTIDLAASKHAGVLVDELAARRVARAVGLNVIGTCGLLLQAKRRDLVAEVRPLVEELSDSGYYLSESLIEAVCRLAGEP
jgi:predicted nucleic acid-binding protein